jgi:hypothetical protein
MTEIPRRETSTPIELLVLTISMIIIPLLLMLLVFAFYHDNYSNSKGCMRNNVIDSYWYNDVCKHTTN